MDLEKTIRSLRGRGFEVTHFATGAEAADYLDGAIRGTTVGIGGSKTIDQLGLYDRLAANNEVFWHWRKPGFETLDRELAAKVFLSSANAITENGEIVSIDGRGNRIANQVYGHKKVIIVSSTSKIVEDMNAAFDRSRSVAAVANGKRFPYNIPCKIDDKCHDCRSPERICRAMTVLMTPMIGMEAEVVLIDEKLGY